MQHLSGRFSPSDGQQYVQKRPFPKNSLIGLKYSAAPPLETVNSRRANAGFKLSFFRVW
jgi:hypothetical protein